MGVQKSLIFGMLDARARALLIETDPELFERYALTDAKIAAVYFSRILDFMEEHGLSIWPLPPTASSIAVRLRLKAAREP